jgi:hypothetical protein
MLTYASVTDADVCLTYADAYVSMNTTGVSRVSMTMNYYIIRIYSFFFYIS